METLKRIFKVESSTQLAVVFFVFGITGSLSVIVSKPALVLAGLSPDLMHGAVYWPLRILGMLIVYQLMLIAVGSIFGQFSYFWRIEKQILGRLGIRLGASAGHGKGQH